MNLNEGNDFDVVVCVFEWVGIICIFVEFNLMVIFGESVNFLVGGEFLVFVFRDWDGNIMFEFKFFGVGFGFMFVVFDEGWILFRILIEVSELLFED